MLLLLLLQPVLTACGNSPRVVARWPATGAVKIGQPYEVAGKRYVPRDDRDYDETGLASWYGPGFHGKSTANGEPYDMESLTAAHKTLPMPSFVEVENLTNDRKLIVRVNDRGPFAPGRIIDLSRRAAQLLGVDRVGVAKVRVRRVYPNERQMRAVPAPVPSPAGGPVPPRLTGRVSIQVAAVSDRGRASWLAGYLEDIGRTRVEATPTGLFRVKLGPFASAEDAASALARVRAAGYEEARIIADAPSD